MVEAYLEILELGYFEAEIAFDELTNENVWKRPAPTFLSVGELAGHVAYWEAARLAGAKGEGEPDLAKCRVKSPLIDRRFAYYPITIANPPSEEQQAMTAQQVRGEFLRVHNESVADFWAHHPDLKASLPEFHQILTYAAFHVAYHAGQMYSARHLLGDKTTDN